jgi:hypothetical protein
MRASCEMGIAIDTRHSGSCDSKLSLVQITNSGLLVLWLMFVARMFLIEIDVVYMKILSDLFFN